MNIINTKKKVKLLIEALVNKLIIQLYIYTKLTLATTEIHKKFSEF